ncbi:MAG: UvrD-helicase domain-containing protein [Cytophagales bacterium]|nr:UvrD-helicase domain-containing protein [Cytophagales bacterium]
MFYIADLHVHSHYSRATSKNLNLESLYQWARVKGIHVIGTGDFTHPQWFKEIGEKLEPEGNGLFRLKDPPRDPALPGMKVEDIDVRFCLSTEISSIYKYGDKVRKNHNLVYAPDLDTVARINARLSAIGNLTADGRPILGLPSRDLLEIVTECSERAYLVPAHVWTPWFSTLGSQGGYNSIEECFRDLSGLVFALETGLSSDPAMNWKWSALDRFTLISNSDAHSPQKLGREANLFDTECSYDGLFDAIKTKQGFLGTYEFYPEEGKYHHDGHRKCGISLKPQDTMHYKGFCPVCKQPLTIGVLNRVEALSDRSESQKPENAASYDHIIPLPEILSEIKNTGPSSKTVMQAFHRAISIFGNEFTLLEKVPIEDIKRHGDPILAEAIRRMRHKEVNPQAGYDGLYGTIRIFEEKELAKLTGALYLFGAPETVPKAKPNPATYYDSTSHRTAETDRVSESTAPLKSSGLNEAQQQIKESVTGSILVKAGPGTGKTSTLIQWIGHQIATEQARPSQVLAITFTNKAASEISERLVRTLGEEAKQVETGTFHALAYKMLQEHSPELDTVYDEANRLSIIRFLFPGLSERECNRLSSALTAWFERNEHTDWESIEKDASTYRDYVWAQHAIDVSDIVGQLVSLWRNDPGILEKQRSKIRSIAVDEFQDINSLQYEFLNMLGRDKNLLAIGDPDQAIYGFRGSDVRLFFRFSDSFHPKEINLTKNYRSFPVVLKAAGQLIGHNSLRSNLVLQATRTGRQKIKVYHAEDPKQEARFIVGEIEKKVGGFNLLSGGPAYHDGNCAFSDLAVLYRTHQVGRELLSHFKQSSIPVILGDGTAFLRSAPFTLIANILKLLLHPHDRIALEGILDSLHGWKRADIRSFMSRIHESKQEWAEISSPPVNITAAESFTKWKEFYTELPGRLAQYGVIGCVHDIFDRYLPDSTLTEEQLLKKEIVLTLAKEAGSDVREFLNTTTLNNYTDTGRQQIQGVHLLTFHAAKGLEFPVVFIAGAEEGITPSGRKDADLEEERRLFYVAMTRARDALYITHATKRFKYGKDEFHERSRFVEEFSSELIDPANPIRSDPKNAPDDGKQLSFF